MFLSRCSPANSMRQVELALEMVIGGAGDHHPARFADLLQTSGDVDAIPEQVIALDHHVAEVDADAEDDPALGGHSTLLLRHALLHGDRAGHRIDHRAELRERAIAHQLDDAAMMLGQERIDDLAPQGFQGGKRPGFVHFHEMGVPDDIRRQDRHQPPLHPCCRHGCFSSKEICRLWPGRSAARSFNQGNAAPSLGHHTMSEIRQRRSNGRTSWGRLMAREGIQRQGPLGVKPGYSLLFRSVWCCRRKLTFGLLQPVP